MRIAMAVVVGVDVFIRWSDLEAFYSNSGAFPLELLFGFDGLYWNPNSWSLTLVSANTFCLNGIFAIAALSSFMLLIGYRSRFFSILLWVWLMSIQNRSPMVLQGGDDYLRLLMFWGIFLPWGRYYSADSIDVSEPQTTRYAGLPAIALLLQITFLYLFTALLKNGPEWHSEGTALYYALSLDQLVKPLGKLLYPHLTLLQWGTWIAVTTEFLIPILIFLPWNSSFFRTVALVLLIILHLFIEITMQVGLFSFICISAGLCLIPSGFYDKIPGQLKVFRKWFMRLVSEFNYILPYRNRVSYPVIGLGARMIILLGLSFGLVWNIHSLYKLPDPVIKRMETLAVPLGWNQNWGMFAPSVFKDDGWYIYEGYNGQDTIDLLREGQLVSYDKPALAVRQYKSARWRKFGENLIFVDNIPMRSYFCSYLLEKWNKEHPDKTISGLKVLYMMEVSLPDYKTKPVSREYLCDCWK